jgi:hypothetical protein
VRRDTGHARTPGSGIAEARHGSPAGAAGHLTGRALRSDVAAVAGAAGARQTRLVGRPASHHGARRVPAVRHSQIAATGTADPKIATGRTTGGTTATAAPAGARYSGLPATTIPGHAAAACTAGLLSSSALGTFITAIARSTGRGETATGTTTT